MIFFHLKKDILVIHPDQVSFKKQSISADLGVNINPAGMYLLKVNKNTRTRCKICSKLTLNIFHTLF